MQGLRIGALGVDQREYLGAGHRIARLLQLQGLRSKVDGMAIDDQSLGIVLQSPQVIGDLSESLQHHAAVGGSLGRQRVAGTLCLRAQRAAVPSSYWCCANARFLRSPSIRSCVVRNCRRVVP
jgi:hypothetical protein